MFKRDKGPIFRFVWLYFTSFVRFFSHFASTKNEWCTIIFCHGHFLPSCCAQHFRKGDEAVGLGFGLQCWIIAELRWQLQSPNAMSMVCERGWGGQAADSDWSVSPPPPLLKWHSDVLSCHLWSYGRFWFLTLPEKDRRPEEEADLRNKLKKGMSTIEKCSATLRTFPL
jgi:hypothetical protein